MDDTGKKKLRIGIIIASLTLAAVITYVTSSGGDSGGSNRGSRVIYIMCDNQDCPESEYEVSTEQYREMMQAVQSPEDRLTGPMMGPMALECKNCSQETAYMSQKCEECETFFSIDYDGASDDYPDRCPECGFSRIEEGQSNR